MNNNIYEEAMENLRNKIDVKLVNNEKDYLQRTSKASYLLQKIFDNNLFVIGKSKTASTFNKPAYTAMFILELSKKIGYKFHYDYIEK